MRSPVYLIKLGDIVDYSITKINILLFLFKFHGAPLFFADILGDFNMVFTLLFTVECIFKLVSFGPRVRIDYFILIDGTHHKYGQQNGSAVQIL